MNQTDVVDILQTHLEGQFPRDCAACGRRYASLREYLENTSHVGDPISYDVEEGEWFPRAPLGTMSLANCACGSTLVLGTDGMSLVTLWRLMGWARSETARRGIGVRALLAELRVATDDRVLHGPARPSRAEPTPGEQLQSWRESLVRSLLDGVCIGAPIITAAFAAARPPPRLASPIAPMLVAWGVVMAARWLAPRRLMVGLGLAALALTGPAMLPFVGLAPGAFVVMVAVVVLATALFGRRGGLLTLAGLLSVTLLIGAVISTGHGPIVDVGFTRPDRFSNWVRTALLLGLASALVVVALSRILERLEAAWRSAASASLREARAAKELAEAEVQRRSSLEAVRASQHLEAMSRVAGGVAHDFNNLLLVILMWADELSEQHDAVVREGVGEIKQAANQACQLTRQLLALGSTADPVASRVDVDGALAALTRSLRRLLPADIAVEHVATPGLPPALVDEAAFGRIVLNLAVNAADAMPGGGTLVLSTSLVDAADVPEPLRSAGVRYLAVRVADTRAGMDEATRARLFEPFFTTKAPGKGTGLGLATVHRTVEQASGFIRVESAPGEGSVFTVALPVADAEADEAIARHPRRPLGGRVVLLVEDEEPVRQVMRMALAAAGATVIEASGTEQALAAARRFRADVHLLCTDGVLAGEPTSKLIEGFRALFPRAEVLVCSGYAPEELARRSLPTAPSALLPKPFTADALVARVAALLDPPVPAR